MQCFKWITRECKNGDKCRLAQPNQTPLVLNKNGGITLKSPDFKLPITEAIKKRYFCIYNISLSCPAGTGVNLAAKGVTSPITDDTKCKDYLAIYTDNRGENIHQKRLCGNEVTPDFRTQLPSGSFSMVLWTDAKANNNAGFEFEATCKAAVTTHPVPVERAETNPSPTSASLDLGSGLNPNTTNLLSPSTNPIPSPLAIQA